MEKQFVNYSIAFKLRELGFNEKCFYQFCIEDQKLFPIVDEYNYPAAITNSTIFNYSAGECIAAPLWQQVLDWLFDNYEILIHRYLAPGNEQFWVIRTTCESYVKSKEQAILKCLESIKE